LAIWFPLAAYVGSLYTPVPRPPAPPKGELLKYDVSQDSYNAMEKCLAYPSQRFPLKQ
jgi:hypothetical protein